MDGGQPTTPQQSTDNNTRAYSLAEAMQAARKLNMDKAQSTSSAAYTPTKQSEIASSENLAEEEDVNQAESEDITLDDNKPFEEDEKTHDNAKNIEIRRMSSTEEGHKVLEPNFNSPDKDEKKNPLQNIFNIVSEMEVPTEEIETAPPKTKVRKRLQYSMLNPAKPGQAAWVLKGVSSNNSTAVLTPSATTSVSYIQAGGTVQQANQPLIMTAAPTSAIPLQAATQQQQVMQLVQTINGPVLVPVGYQTTILPASTAIPLSASQQLSNKDDSFSDQSLSPESARLSPANAGKGKSRRTRKRKASGDDDNDIPENNGSQLLTVAQPQGIIQQPNLSQNIVLTSGKFDLYHEIWYQMNFFLHPKIL